MGESHDTVPVLPQTFIDEVEASKGTMPVDPQHRIPESDIRIELCSPSDVDEVVCTTMSTTVL